MNKIIIITTIVLLSYFAYADLSMPSLWNEKVAELCAQPSYNFIRTFYPKALRTGTITFNALYDAVAAGSKGKMSPYLCHEEWEDFKFCKYGNCKPKDEKTFLAANYAAYRALSLIFNDSASHLNLANFMSTKFGISPVSNSYDVETPEGIGNTIGYNAWYDKENDRSNDNGDMSGSTIVNPISSEYTDYQPINPPMPTFGHAGDCSKLNLNHYQALNGSSGITGYATALWAATRPFAPVPFPVAAPWKYQRNTNAQWLSDWDNMLSIFSNLGDNQKVLAHYFASGIQKDFVSKWGFLVQLQTMIDATESKNLNFKDGIKLQFYAFNSGNDGIITATKNKRFYDIVRPTTAMQCVYTGQTITSWKGPYQGVGTMQGEDWTAWHGNVNNPSPEYPCEHCLNFGVAAQVLTNFFGTNKWFGRNVTIGAGTFDLEKKITVGNPGYIAGKTDVPNTGPNSVGYAPATDIPLGWATNDQFAADCAQSRVNFGVHTRNSAKVGKEVGYEVANRGWRIVKKLFEGKGSCKPINEDFIF